MSGRVRMKDLAEAAGVHVSTVSLALRGRESISKEMRERIRKLADEMGYRPDPRLDAFNYQRSLQVRSRSLPSVAYVCDLPGAHALAGHKEHGPVFAGVKAFCDAGEVALDCFFLGGGSLSSARLNTILESRGINALVVHFCGDEALELELNWEQFCVVKVDSHRGFPKVDSLGPNYRQAARMAVEAALQRGYKRPGLVLGASMARRLKRMYEVGYMLELMESGREVLPVCYWDGSCGDLAECLKEGGVDCLITPEVQAVRASGVLDAGLPVFGLMEAGDEGLPWVKPVYEEVGRQVVQLLVQKIQTNEKGFGDAACLEWIPVLRG